MSKFNPSAFDVVDYEFRRLCASGFTINATEIDARLPQRELSPLILKAVLLHPSSSSEVRDVAWRWLILKARTSQQWFVVALGMLQPGMRNAAGRLSRATELDREELDAEFLSGVVDALRNIDENQNRLALLLIEAGKTRTRRLMREVGRRKGDLSDEVLENFANISHLDTSESNHPEVALIRAVGSGVISSTESDLIATTRLGDSSLAEFAENEGVSVDTLRHRRNRAERKLKAWLIENK